MFRFQHPNLTVWIGFLQRAADAGDRASGAKTGAETIDRTIYLFQNFFSGTVTVSHWIGRIIKLLRQIHSWVFLRHTLRGQQTLLDGITDVAFIVNQNQLCTVHFYQLTAFFADGVRHDNTGFIAFYSANQSQTNPLIAAGRLYDDGVRFQQTLTLRFLDHGAGSPCFGGAAHVKTLKFYKNSRTVLVHHALQLNHWGIAHCFQNIVKDHASSSFKV